MTKTTRRLEETKKNNVHLNNSLFCAIKLNLNSSVLNIKASKQICSAVFGFALLYIV